MPRQGNFRRGPNHHYYGKTLGNDDRPATEARRRPIHTPYGQFASLSDAARYHGTKARMVHYWLSIRKDGWRYMSVT